MGPLPTIAFAGLEDVISPKKSGFVAEHNAEVKGAGSVKEDRKYNDFSWCC